MGAAGRRGNIKKESEEDHPSSHIDPDNQIGAYSEFQPLDQDTWFSCWDEELAIAYHVLVDQCQQFGYAFFENCKFPDFVDFAYKFSSKRPPRV